MEHNLSFWREPDWRRESTVSPIFLAIIVLSMFVLVALAFTSYVFSSRLGTKSEYDRLINENAKIAARAKVVQDYKTRIAQWQSYLDELDARERNRIVWSRQFEALQSLVPNEIVLSQLALRSTRVKEDPTTAGGVPAAGAEPKVVTRYTLTILGVAYGDNVQGIISRFAESLAQQPEIGRYLENRELRDIRGGDAETGTTFTIVCTYKPIG
jgi:Tfp pilus assembly protein PilN